MAHAVHLIHRQPSTLLNNASPNQILFDAVPSLDQLNVGCWGQTHALTFLLYCAN